MDWREEYKRKLATPEEAVKIVQSGESVTILGRNEPGLLPTALAKRANELRGVRIAAPQLDGPNPFPQDSTESFILTGRTAGDVTPTIVSLELKAGEERQGPAREIDVVMGVVSPPDKDGFCSYGHYMLTKPTIVKRARKVVMEVNRNVLRVGGDVNAIHVSRVDAFVEHDAPLWKVPPHRSVGEADRRIAEYVAELVRDGDTLEWGIGSAVDILHTVGAFKGRRDLGCFSGSSRVGMVADIKAGIFTGKEDNVNRGKLVLSAMYLEEEDYDFVNDNPIFLFYELKDINNIVKVAAHDNFLALNSAVSADLFGQVTAEGVRAAARGGGVAPPSGGGGGLTGFAIGSVLSRGGRSVIVFPSTARGGTVSKISAHFDAGTVITVPWTFADTIVTEYGVARLLGKSLRQRAEEMIAIAHPDFREDLRKAARSMGVL
ncbi:MAG: hypothetical protein HY680_09730 [Chloroflexi bacterium]|nr:hypothetical protein [Chloroflexota bacterium]